ncbi:MAG TPA: SGNH/GDSL hydrolase family protein [Thermoleophilaceae bacterium]|nr:SGNH/GDSL hydrolase family protein [Thermoleophilaceae bacterium]
MISVSAEAPPLRGARWQRVVVLGDSIAEGVREPYDGYRDLSWIDRVAEALAASVAGLELTNLGRRNLFAAEVRERQLETAVALRPDLAIVAAGGNDALHPSFAPDELRGELDAIVAPLRRAGADVLMIELLDIVASGLIPPAHADALDERLRALAEITRAIARRHGALLVEMRTHPAAADPDIYASDRLHLNARGHAIVGAQAVRVLSEALATRQALRPPALDLSFDEVTEQLFWPHRPPGEWALAGTRSQRVVK